VFDLDGTLIDSKGVMLQAFTVAHRKEVGEGQPPLEGFLNLLGDSFTNILTQLGLPQSMDEVFRSESIKHSGDIMLHPGVMEMCLQLQKMFITMGIQTGKDGERVSALLHRLSVGRFFEVVVTGSDNIAPKPSPDGLNWICGQLRSSPSSTFYLGDSPYDMKAAVAAGVRAIGCSWGIAPPDELMGSGAEYIVESPQEFVELVRTDQCC
jgi:AHBA synthesis associated protein